jgi:5,10-methylenetetrahydromethanopterin reductase
MQISCAFPTTMDSPDLIRVAEELGYERAWVYDTPQQSPDVWMTLAMAAERTSTIGLGPGVLVPNLRHPMTNAAATATLVALAPGRVVIGFGTGFSGRRAMGYRAIPWSYMAAYITAYKGLLAGEVVEWEGARMQMLHPADHGAPRPIKVPIIIGALGPKGKAVAQELGDGLYVTLSAPDFAHEFSSVSMLMWGTVLEDGEDSASARVKAAAGPGTALAWHGSYEFGGPAATAEVPGGPAWLEVVNREPEQTRHLKVHAQHCVGLNEADEAAWAEVGPDLATSATFTGSPKEVGARVGDLAGQGVTEVVYQPCGPDIRRELETFRAAVTS